MAVNHPANDRWRRTVRGRVLVMASVMALWGVAMEARLVHLQVFRYDALVEQAERQQSRSVKTIPKRGEILDREGRLQHRRRVRRYQPQRPQKGLERIGAL